MTEALKRFIEVKTNNSTDYKEIFQNPIFWQSVPAFRLKHENLGFKGNRNNFAVAAINSWVHKHLDEIGVIFVDLFTLSRTMEDMRVCGDHFLCHRDKYSKIHGAVGITAAKMIINKLCS